MRMGWSGQGGPPGEGTVKGSTEDAEASARTGQGGGEERHFWEAEWAEQRKGGVHACGVLGDSSVSTCGLQGVNSGQVSRDGWDPRGKSRVRRGHLP